MAVTRRDGVIYFGAAGDVATEALDVASIVITASGASEAVSVKDGAGTIVLFVVDVASTGPVVINFGNKPHHFPQGLEMDTSTTAGMIVFLA